MNDECSCVVCDNLHRVIHVPPDVAAFVCPGCNQLVDGDTFDDAVRDGEFRCGVKTWRVFTMYIIEEQAL